MEGQRDYGISILKKQAAGFGHLLAGYPKLPMRGEPLVLGLHGFGLAVGVMVWDLYANVAELRYFYIDPSLRQRGIGRYFLMRVLHDFRESGVRTVGASLCIPADGQTAMGTLLEAAGFGQEEERIPVWEFTLGDVLEGPLQNSLHKKSSNILGRDGVSKAQLKEFYGNYLMKKTGSAVPSTREGLMKESVFYSKEGVLQGMLSFVKGTDAIDVDYLYAEDAAMIARLLGNGADRLAEAYGASTRLHAAAAVPRIENLILSCTQGKARKVMETIHYTQSF